MLRPLEGQGFLPVPLEKWPWHKGCGNTSLLRSPLTVLGCLSGYRFAYSTTNRKQPQNYPVPASNAAYVLQRSLQIPVPPFSKWPRGTSHGLRCPTNII